MIKNKLDQNGFSAVMVVLIVVIIGIIGFTGWYVYNSVQKGNKTTEETSNPQTNPSSTSKVTPTKVDETANWKTYENKQYSFSFKYPSYASMDLNDKTAPYIISIGATPINQIEDAPNGYTKENILKDLEAIKKGDASVSFTPGTPSSYKIVVIPSAYAKKYTSLTGHSVCVEQFARASNIYKDNIYIHLGASILEPTKEKVKEANPKYFDKVECPPYYGIKEYSLFDTLYTDLEAGKTDNISQKWFTDFDKILATFKFN